jgi:Putative peptidoglycan binding domain
MATWPIVKSPDQGENVRTVQYLLDASGSSIAVDGSFGPNTTAAVKSFQTAHGLTADGIVGNQTWPKLVVTVQSGSNGPAVKAVQSQVDARLPKHLAIDGAFGSQTKEAVTGFQGPIGLTADGIVGQQTWNRLVNGYLGAKNGESAAKKVFDAWQDGDQPRAAKWATHDAVLELFAITPHPATGPTMQGAAGSWFATWIGPALGELTIQGNNNTGAPYYYATSAKVS